MDACAGYARLTHHYQVRPGQGGGWAGGRGGLIHALPGQPVDEGFWGFHADLWMRGVWGFEAPWMRGPLDVSHMLAGLPDDCVRMCAYLTVRVCACT